ncbi:MAG: FAD-binding oxidoreductase [Acidobacteria bacterium]|nr:FAD-binding oxidoreductase [Acidobacteriota bacterium]
MLLQKLASLLTEDQIGSYQHKLKYLQNKTLPIVYPHSIEQLAEVLLLANKEKLMVLPIGGGTKLKIGNPPAKADFFLSTKKLNQILIHESADLTTTVQAGTTFADFQNCLNQHNQYLPLDPPFAKQATVGGVIVTNSYGPTRLANGTIKDWLIGIKVVGADGSISKAGGKVVKNVAGYDLMKLYTGSFGTLAIIVEASFKLRPKPLDKAIILGEFTSSNLAVAINNLLSSQLQPIALELLNQQIAKLYFPQIQIKENHSLLIAQFAGSTNAIKYQQETLSTFWKNLTKEIITIYQSDKDYLSWQKLVDFAEEPNIFGQFQVAVLPSQVLALVSEITKTLNLVTKDYYLLVQPGKGTIQGFFDQNFINNFIINDLDNLDETTAYKLGELVAALSQIRNFTEKIGGHLILMDDAFIGLLDTWGTPPASVMLMKTIKNKLDPLNILNPGRFVGGI